MIATRAAGVRRAPALLVAVVVASLARTALGGDAVAASAPAAAVFAAILIGAALWATRAHLARVSGRGIAMGVAGAVALVGLSLVGLPVVRLGPRAAASVLAWWVPLVTVVAAAEELVLRGALFDALGGSGRSGDVVAVAVTAALFAVIHLPLYGVGALGIDLCVGVFLGCLRVLSGGVSAPLVAHVLADLATGWLG